MRKFVWLGGLLLLDGDDAFEHAENVALLHDQELLAVELDLGARPFAEQHPVAGLHVERLNVPFLIGCARAYGDDFALLRLLLGGIGNDDPAPGPVVLLNATHDNAIMQWTKLHLCISS